MASLQDKLDGPRARRSVDRRGPHALRWGQLSNGIQTLAVPVAGPPSTASLLLIRAGSRDDPRGREGTARLVADAVLGVGAAETGSIRSRADELGALIGSFATKEYTGFYVRSGSTATPSALALLSDLLRFPELEDETVERERAMAATRARAELRAPRARVQHLFERLVYGSGPLGHPTPGTERSLERIRARDLRAFVASRYTSDRIAVGVAGDVSGTTVQDVERLFGTLPARTSRAGRSRDAQPVPARTLRVERGTWRTAHLSVGVPTYPLAHRDRYALQVLANMLGGYPSARLCVALRERLGAAYDVRARSGFVSLHCFRRAPIDQST